MKDCNAKAEGKKGDERSKFMSSCLKGETAGPSDKQKAQQNKMKDCNKQAEGKKGVAKIYYQMAARRATGSLKEVAAVEGLVGRLLDELRP